MSLFQRFFSDRSGATAIEYGLIGGIIAVAIIAGFGAMTQQLTNVFNAAKDALAKP
ncbi:Flp family type IVb pilin [Rhizobium sp. DKSPLA3]|uniref:Flp family type IVb pilin n=1 Tax=Rhizobium quercicola TaxID=2901226 RepID=A0A9X1T231_9HYPH|nr:Flp family type IVb pilin [Rhizobium quercicola]MCD7110679.1 Flp family type IVb pilin [Rhizobium quercicola]